MDKVLEAEVSLISLILHQPELLTEVEPYIKADDIKVGQYSRLLFEGAVELAKQNKLTKENLIEATNANTVETDKVDKTKVVEKYYNADYDVDRLDGYISLVLTGQDLSKYHVRSLLGEYKRETERNKLIPIDQRIFRPSLIDLTKAIGGYYRGELSVLGARPGLGKSSFALQMCREFGRKDRRTAYIQLEMTAMRQIDRMMVSTVDDLLFEEILELSYVGNPIKEKDWLRGFAELHKDEMYIVTGDKKNNFSDWKELKKLILDLIKMGVRFFEIDSLNLMYWSEINEPKRNYALDRILQDILSICTSPDYGYPHIKIVCHLNRDCEQRANKRPQKSDLKDTGSLEQWSDLVELMYRDEYYNPDTDAKNIAEFIIEKNRNRPFPTLVRVQWQGSKFTFRNLQQEYLL